MLTMLNFPLGFSKQKMLCRFGRVPSPAPRATRSPRPEVDHVLRSAAFLCFENPSGKFNIVSNQTLTYNLDEELSTGSMVPRRWQQMKQARDRVRHRTVSLYTVTSRIENGRVHCTNHWAPTGLSTTSVVRLRTRLALTACLWDVEDCLLSPAPITFQPRPRRPQGPPATD